MKPTPIKLSSRDLIAIDRERYERNFADFIAAAWEHVDPAPFMPNWHIKTLADHLQDVFEVGGQKLLINICPGSAKSKIVSVLFPAWVWARDARKRIISASHSEELAIRDAAEHRKLIKSEWFQRYWRVEMEPDQDGKSSFSNNSMGFRKANPIGSMTGHRGNIVIVDDPHSVKGAESDVVRASVVHNFLGAVMNRLNEPSEDSIIVVMQRLHEDDVAGVILSKPELGFDHLCIPLFADGEVRKPTRIGWVDWRAEGDNMFPQRFTPKYIAEQQSALGPFRFAGQYQQRPAPTNDGYFERDWFDIYKADNRPGHLYYYMTSDHAPGGKGDYNVFQVWGVDASKNLWLVDQFRRRCKMDEALGIVRDPATGKAAVANEGALALIRKWQPVGWYPENDMTWSAIRSFVESALHETETLVRIVPLATRGSGDKMSKSTAFQAMASMGRVHLPEGPISDDLLLEMSTFPNGKHDDQVDACSAIARVMADMLPAFIPQTTTASVKDIYELSSLEDTTDSCWG